MLLKDLSSYLSREKKNWEKKEKNKFKINKLIFI